MGPVSIGVEIQTNTDGGTPSTLDSYVNIEKLKSHIY